MNDKKIRSIIRLFQDLNTSEQLEAVQFLIDIMRNNDKSTINYRYKKAFGKTLGPYDEKQCECCGK